MILFKSSILNYFGVKMDNKNELLEYARVAFCLKHKIHEQIGKIYSIPPIEVDMLTFVYIYGESATATNIEKERNLKKNTISIHVENLVQKNYLIRHDRQGDRRKIELSLTESGKIIAETCLKEYKELGNKLKVGLSKQQIDTLNHCFEVINKNALKLLNK